MDRLTEVFNAHAGKVINLIKVEAEMHRELQRTLTSEQFDTYFELLEKNDSEKLQDAVRAQRADGTLGLYIYGPELFAEIDSIKLMMEFNAANIFPPAMAEKVVEAMANALQHARDYTPELRSGILRPLK